ncbi:MAG TPA: carbonic anhydrase family protein [Candidatus Acidoferrum sp.]|jgi:carbonic anhydrase
MIRRSASLFLCLLITASLPAFPQDAKPEFSYSGANGPKAWGNLTRAYYSCKYGHMQSPINIWGASREVLPAIQFEYKDTPLRIIDNGHTIQVNYPLGSWITVGETRYELRQFHFHHPSEEHINGEAYDMTLHLVHQNSEGQLAVVAVLLRHGTPNATIQKIWDNLPRIRGKEQEISSVTINAAALLPQTTGYYTYRGSLTTPPCTEGVTWFVLKTPAEISSGQVTAFAKVYPHNARPIQPKGLRVISQSDF